MARRFDKLLQFKIKLDDSPGNGIEFLPGWEHDEKFDPAQVRFDNPQKRWETAFGPR